VDTCAVYQRHAGVLVDDAEARKALVVVEALYRSAGTWMDDGRLRVVGAGGP
jgi:hypothetical protein